MKAPNDGFNSFRNDRFLLSEELNGDGALPLGKIRQDLGLFVMVVQTLGGDHFGHHIFRTVFLA